MTIITEEGYDALPDDVRKRIEVIGGKTALRQSGTREHSDVARRLTNRLEALKPAEPCSRVSSDIDVHFVKHLDSGGEFSFRRPDVTVYKCIPRGTKVRTPDALMVVEVVSPGSGSTGAVDKLTEVLSLDQPFPVSVPFAQLDG